MLGLSGKAYLRLVLLGALIGIPAALMAAAFLAVVQTGENLLWDDLPDALGYASPPWFLILGVPTLGGLVVLLARRFLPGDGGHSPLNGIGGGATALSHVPGIALAAFGTLAFGAVLGPEAPLIALGSAVGVAVTLLVRLGPRETEVMGTAGSFSAVSALFGGPLVAGMLLLEGAVGLGAAVIPVLLPGLVAAAIGYLIFVGLGSWAGLDAAGLRVPDLPAYDGTKELDLLVALVVGVVLAFAMFLVRRLATVLSEQSSRRGVGLFLVGAVSRSGCSRSRPMRWGWTPRRCSSLVSRRSRPWCTSRRLRRSWCSSSRKPWHMPSASAAASAEDPSSQRSSSASPSRCWPGSGSTCRRPWPSRWARAPG